MQSFARGDQGHALELRFLGTSPDAHLEPGDRAAGIVSHLPGTSETGLPTYEELMFRGEAGTLEYAFHVRPGADVSHIRVDYEGADGLSLGLDGTLTAQTALGELRDAARAGDAVRHAGPGGYGFTPGHHRGRPFVIARDLVYSTLLGGTAGDSAGGIAVDERGNAYVTGETASAEFPTTPGAYDQSSNANTDAFVTKLDPSGSKLVYSTLIGGNAFDSGHAIAVDERGSAYITGFTGSLNYPTTPGAFDPGHNGGGEAFVTKLNPSGSALGYSTFLGGTGSDVGNAIAADETGRTVRVAGSTTSADFPAPTHPGGSDAFVTALRTHRGGHGH